MIYVEDDHAMLIPGQLGHTRQGSKGKSCQERRKYTLCFGLGSQTGNTSWRRLHKQTSWDHNKFSVDPAMLFHTHY